MFLKYQIIDLANHISELHKKCTKKLVSNKTLFLILHNNPKHTLYLSRIS